MVPGWILDEPHFGVLGRRPAKDFFLAARRSSFQRAEAHLPVVADRREKEEIPLQEHGLSKFRKSQGHTSRVSSLKREKKNAVWFFGEEMWDLILG